MHVVSSVEAWDELAPRWRALVASAKPTVAPFVAPEFARAWWSVFGSEGGAQGGAGSGADAGDEGGERDQIHRRRPQRPFADAHHRFDDDDQDGRFNPDKCRRDHRYLGIKRICDAERQHDQRAGQHEKNAGDQPTPDSVQQPADIGRKLLRLRSRHEHAVVERMQEAGLVDPVPFLDDHAVHQHDLTGGPAETEQADLQPDFEGVAARWRLGLGVHVGHRRFHAGHCSVPVLRHHE